MYYAMTERHIEECKEVLCVLSDVTRHKIVRFFLKKKEACAGDIAEMFSLSRPAISHHLNLMRRADILRTRRAGKEIHYSLNKKYVVDLLESMVDTLKRCQ